MAIATFKDLCIDSSDSEELGRFWAETLGLQFRPDDAAGVLEGESPEQRIWMNVVPEPKTVKHRVHLDVHTAAVDELVERGARVLEPAETFGRRWTVMADPEGGELCAFVREPAALPAYRLYEMVVDCADSARVSRWWADVLAAEAVSGGGSEWWLEGVPGLPFEGWVFDVVPEPKTVKNRIHWDVSCEAVSPLVDAGATLLRSPDDDISWHVLADPEGNEFCAFVTSS